MNRTRLPNRRPAENIAFVHNGHAIIMNVGYDPHGNVKEIFIVHAGKSGADLNIALLETSTATSLALQHGCSLETVRAAFPKREDNSSEGIVGHGLDLLAQPKLEVVT